MPNSSFRPSCDEAGDAVERYGALALHLDDVADGGERGVDDRHSAHRLAREQPHDADPQVVAVLLRHVQQRVVTGLPGGVGLRYPLAKLLELLWLAREVLVAVAVEELVVLLARVARHLIVEVVRPEDLELLGEQVLADAHVQRAHQHVVLVEQRALLERILKAFEPRRIRARLREPILPEGLLQVASLLLVHFGIGHCEHGVDVGRARGPIRPEGHEKLAVASIAVERRFQLLHRPLEVVLAQAACEHDELVAAEAVELCPLGPFAHPSCALAQQGVAAHVPVAVVDALQPVDVDEDDAQGFSGFLEGLGIAGEAVPIVEAGQLVAIALVEQLPFGSDAPQRRQVEAAERPHERLDVLDPVWLGVVDADEAGGLPVLIEWRYDEGLHLPPLQDAVLSRKRLSEGLDVLDGDEIAVLEHIAPAGDGRGVYVPHVRQCGFGSRGTPFVSVAQASAVAAHEQVRPFRIQMRAERAQQLFRRGIGARLIAQRPHALEDHALCIKRHASLLAASAHRRMAVR